MAREARRPTEIVYGLRACLAVLARRPGDVVRVGASAEARREIELAAKGAAARGRRAPPVEALGDRDLERVAKSTQHEGVVIEAHARAWTPPSALADRLVASSPRGVAVALDRVRNSYNVGAIVRSAAFFGVDAALFGPTGAHGGAHGGGSLDPNAVRVAEGGVEHLLLARTTDLADTLGRLRARGVRVFGADGHATTDALAHRYDLPCVIVLGNEREGLADRVREQCDQIVAIRPPPRAAGDGLESLNVGAAAAVLFAAITRARPWPPKT